MIWKSRMRLTLKTSSFDNFTGDGAATDDVDDVFPRFLLSPTMINIIKSVYFHCSV